jgi:hypothetical protein
MNRQISKWGEVVWVRPRVETVDDDTGTPVFTYPEEKWYTIKAEIYDASGLREEWVIIGLNEDTDFVASTYAYLADVLNIDDQIELGDGTLTRIIAIVRRGRGSRTALLDHIELLLRRV